MYTLLKNTHLSSTQRNRKEISVSRLPVLNIPYMQVPKISNIAERIFGCVYKVSKKIQVHHTDYK